MEFGNIGNYYIIEPFIRELHRVFTNCEIRTTLQMSDRFCLDEKITVLPMSLYYGGTNNDLVDARNDVEAARSFLQTGKLDVASPFINEVLWADIVVDFSGDIWGDNADLLGPNRFEVGLLRDQTAQMLGKKTVMLAGSPGPFANDRLRHMAQETYKSFDLVTNREPLSTELLKAAGFDCSKTLSLACPSFLFEPAERGEIGNFLEEIRIMPGEKNKPIIGFALCGWNFEAGPFDAWPREDAEYKVFAEAVEYMSEDIGARVCIFSHSNGFDPPPEAFRLKHGRDYPIAKQLQHVLERRGMAKDFIVLDEVYEPWQTKAIIGSMDMLVSGRVHASVAALSQSVPTVLMDYGHAPEAHKIRGFASVSGADEFVTDPFEDGTLREAIRNCWESSLAYRARLSAHMPSVRKEAMLHFQALKKFES